MSLKSNIKNLQSNIKFKLAGEGFFFPVSKEKPQNLTKPTKKGKALTYPVIQGKNKKGAGTTTFTTLGDMLLHKYTIDFIATLKGDKVVITGGELGEWRLTQYQHGTVFSQLQNRPNETPISIEHDCGPNPEAGPVGEDPVDKKWVWAMTPGEDRRRRLCNHCKKRIPETIKGLIKLIE